MAEERCTPARTILTMVMCVPPVGSGPCGTVMGMWNGGYHYRCMSSYQVKALFTSVLLDHALDNICCRLQQDQLPQSRTSLSIHSIITHLEFGLKSTFFTFKGRYYEQVHGAAMGSTISPLVVNLFIEDFEARALRTSPNLLGSGFGTWMTPLFSTRQNTPNSS